MKLLRAMLCVQCDEIYDGQECPSCGCKVQFPMARAVRPMEARDSQAMDDVVSLMTAVVLPAEGGDTTEGEAGLNGGDK